LTRGWQEGSIYQKSAEARGLNRRASPLLEAKEKIMHTLKRLLVGSLIAWMLVPMISHLALAVSVEEELKALLLQYYAALTNADITFIDDTTTQNPEVTLLGTDPGEVILGHANVIQFWQDLFDGLGGGLTTVPGADSPDVIAHEGGVAWLMDTQSTWRLPGPGSHGGDQPFRLTAVLRKEGNQWKLIQQHYSVGVPNDLLPFP
jgi:ketosteroid isomerase-like protein